MNMAVSVKPLHIDIPVKMTDVRTVYSEAGVNETETKGEKPESGCCSRQRRAADAENSGCDNDHGFAHSKSPLRTRPASVTISEDPSWSSLSASFYCTGVFANKPW